MTFQPSTSATPPRPTRVVLVDDHHIVRSGLRHIIDSLDAVKVVGEAANGAEALSCITALSAEGRPPDVVLMDLSMRVPTEGFRATTDLLSFWPEISVIILTAFEADEHILRAVHAGASGFLLKDASPDLIEHAIHGARLGQAAFSTTALRALADSATTTARLPVGLTERETEISRLLARSLTNREIAEVLFVSEATVKTHVANILGKLGVGTRQEAADYAAALGLIEPT